MHYINEQNKEEKKKNLKIYILRQVNTLDKGFKLSYACKVFHCRWQTIPNFNNTVSKKVLSNIHATLTYKQFTNMPMCCFVWADKKSDHYDTTLWSVCCSLQRHIDQQITLALVIFVIVR